MLVVGVFAAFAVLRSYLRSDRFRVLVGDKVADYLRAEGGFGAFDWKETTAFAAGFEARGFEDATFSRLDVDGIRIDIDLDAAFDGVWKLTEIEGKRLVAVIDGNRLTGLSPRGLRERATSEAGDGGSPDGQGRSWIPNRVEVGRVEIGQAEVVVAADDGGSRALRGTRVLATFEPTGAVVVEGWGGNLTIDGLPEIALDEVSARVTPDTIFLNSATGTFHEGARLAVEGDVSRSRPTEVALDVTFRELDAAKVLPEDWLKRLRGVLSGEITVTGEPGKLREAGTIRLENGILEGLPVLDKIAAYSKTDNFRRLILREAEARFTREGGRLDVPALVLESTGLIRIEGGFALEDSVIDGTFQVGVTPGALRWIPGAEQKVFTRSEGGYLWTTMRISGPMGEVREDLTARLVKGAVERAALLVPDKVVEMVPAAGDAAEGVIEGAKEAIRTGRELLKELNPFD